MPIFPRIQSPCPYKGRLSDIMEGDTCRVCDRRVLDINELSDAERVALFRNCDERVCVTYKFPIRAAIAAAAAAAALATPLSAAAQDFDENLIIVGAIADPASVEFTADPRAPAPELPVVYEAEDQAAPETAKAAQPAADEPSVAADFGHVVEAH